MAPRILLVDDEASLRCIAARALRLEGYEVVEAGDGIEGWALAETHSFDLVITDSRMPGLSGSELLRRLRQLHPALPVCGSPGATALARTRATRPLSTSPSTSKSLHERWTRFLEVRLEPEDEARGRG